MGDKRPGIDRRQVLKYVMIGGVATAVMMPSKWVKPVVNAVIPPAHAAASAPATTKPGTSTTTSTTTTTTTSSSKPASSSSTKVSQATAQSLCDASNPGIGPVQAVPLDGGDVYCGGANRYYTLSTK